MIEHQSHAKSFAPRLPSGKAKRASPFAVISVGFGECMVSGCCCKPDEQPWTYTVGLIERGLPELVVLGLDPLSAHEGITWVANRAKKGFSVPLNMRDPLDDFDLKLVDVPFDWLATDPSRMAAWFNHYDSGPLGSIAPDVRQLVWADDKGIFPDDPICDSRVIALQPLLNVDPFTHPQRATPRRNPARHRRPARR